MHLNRQSIERYRSNAGKADWCTWAKRSAWTCWAKVPHSCCTTLWLDGNIYTNNPNCAAFCVRVQGHILKLFSTCTSPCQYYKSSTSGNAKLNAFSTLNVYKGLIYNAFRTVTMETKENKIWKEIKHELKYLERKGTVTKQKLIQSNSALMFCGMDEV